MIPKILPSYLYLEYNDDDDLQALVAAYNIVAQEYLDFFNTVNLPIYTGVNSLVSGALLDFVATNLYGFPRPVLPFGHATVEGVFNSFVFNTLAFNAKKTISPAVVFNTTDDIYRRCLTWLFYKGDGKNFSIRWLKRRVERFLFFENGTGLGVDQTYRVSVTFGADFQVNINITKVVTEFGPGAFNSWAFNTRTMNSMSFTITLLPPISTAPIFKAAVEAGVLELPFQFTWIVNI